MNQNHHQRMILLTEIRPSQQQPPPSTSGTNSKLRFPGVKGFGKQRATVAPGASTSTQVALAAPHTPTYSPPTYCVAQNDSFVSTKHSAHVRFAVGTGATGQSVVQLSGGAGHSEQFNGCGGSGGHSSGQSSGSNGHSAVQLTGAGGSGGQSAEQLSGTGHDSTYSTSHCCTSKVLFSAMHDSTWRDVPVTHHPQFTAAAQDPQSPMAPQSSPSFP